MVLASSAIMAVCTLLWLLIVCTSYICSLVDIDFTGILPPGVEVTSSSSSSTQTTKTDSKLYRAALTHVGKAGEAELKALIISRVQDVSINMIHSGAHDDVRVKAMSNAQIKLTAFACILYLILISFD